MQLADILINESQGIIGLSSFHLHDLLKIKGISKVKAIELLACFELSKRVARENLFESIQVSSPKLIADYLNQKIGSKKQEHFVVLFLNTKNQLINEQTLFIGSLNSSVVHVREIFKAAMENTSAKIVVAHNHPSGDCIPSEQDVLVTNTIQQVAELVGIPLLDHIIVGQNNYFSFKEKQLLK